MATSLPIDVCTANLESGLGNLLDVYAKASTLEKINGKLWYSTAHDDAVRISELYNIPLLTVVQVACALSPRLAWEQNMPAAEAVVRWFVAGGYVPDIAPYKAGLIRLQRTRHTEDDEIVVADDANLPIILGPTRVNVCKALWILQGHTWVLRGKKVSSFCDNIINHATSDAVTVDSHAIQCWFGKMEPGTYSVPPSMYDIIAADYRKAAAIVGLTPLQFQAVTWVAKKRITAEVEQAQRAAAKAERKQAKALAKLLADVQM